MALIVAVHLPFNLYVDHFPKPKWENIIRVRCISSTHEPEPPPTFSPSLCQDRSAWRQQLLWQLARRGNGLTSLNPTLPSARGSRHVCSGQWHWGDFPQHHCVIQFSHRHHLCCMKIHLILTENLKIAVCVRVFRKLRATLDEYTTRVGQQAIVLCISPSKPNPVFKVFGAAPLENVVSSVSRFNTLRGFWHAKSSPFTAPSLSALYTALEIPCNESSCIWNGESVLKRLVYLWLHKVIKVHCCYQLIYQNEQLIIQLFCTCHLGEEIQGHDAGGPGERPGWTRPCWRRAGLRAAPPNYWWHPCVCGQDDAGQSWRTHPGSPHLFK